MRLSSGGGERRGAHEGRVTKTARFKHGGGQRLLLRFGYVVRGEALRWWVLEQCYDLSSKRGDVAQDEDTDW